MTASPDFNMLFPASANLLATKIKRARTNLGQVNPSQRNEVLPYLLPTGTRPEL
jgi:hypothetical protein